jgi:hypothetical protein
MNKKRVDIKDGNIKDGLYEIFSNKFFVLIRGDVAWVIGISDGQSGFQRNNKNSFLNSINYMFIYEYSDELKKKMIEKILGE